VSTGAPGMELLRGRTGLAHPVISRRGIVAGIG
jgi:hypothetical protein